MSHLAFVSPGLFWALLAHTAERFLGSPTIPQTPRIRIFFFFFLVLRCVCPHSWRPSVFWGLVVLAHFPWSLTFFLSLSRGGASILHCLLATHSSFTKFLSFQLLSFSHSQLLSREDSRHLERHFTDAWVKWQNSTEARGQQIDGSRGLNPSTAGEIITVLMLLSSPQPASWKHFPGVIKWGISVLKSTINAPSEWFSSFFFFWPLEFIKPNGPSSASKPPSTHQADVHVYGTWWRCRALSTKLWEACPCSLLSATMRVSSPPSSLFAPVPGPSGLTLCLTLALANIGNTCDLGQHPLGFSRQAPGAQR